MVSALQGFRPVPGSLDKHRITTPWVVGLVVLAALPLLLVTTRIAALGGSPPTGPAFIGDWLNRNFHLLWIGSEERGAAVTILLLPMAALLTAFTRLTLGLRVLGFRAILIAIGFQEIGFMASLLLLGLVATAAITVRPLMRRVGMPLYARVAAILCVVAMTLFAGLLGGASLGSGTLWSMAFFPVVILAMLAESFADTVARDNLAMALWRLVVTLLLAGVIAGLSQITALRELALAAPELILTQLLAIVLLSEFGDWRLFESFRPGTGGVARKRPVVVVRNRFGEAPPVQRGRSVPKRYRQATLQPLVDGLRSKGFAVEVLEADATLPWRLRNTARRYHHLPRVLNFAGGMQGAGRRSWVPACCEMLGLAYSGPAPQSPALWDDRRAQLDLLERAGLATPRRLSMEDACRRLAAGASSVVVRPRREADRAGKRVTRRHLLEREVAGLGSFGEEALIEADDGGRRITVVIFDGAPGDVPPVLLEHTKHGWIAVATRDAAAAEELVGAALLACSTLECRGPARVDLEIDAGGRIAVWQVDAPALPGRKSALHAALTVRGLTFADFGCLLVDGADATPDDADTDPAAQDGRHENRRRKFSITPTESKHAIFLPTSP
jgi:hypothetical protein